MEFSIFVLNSSGSVAQPLSPIRRFAVRVKYVSCIYSGWPPLEKHESRVFQNWFNPRHAIQCIKKKIVIDDRFGEK
jgi:hypothetical protein